MNAAAVARPTSRPNTLDRFDAAVRRAKAERIAVIERVGERALVSASNGRDAYLIIGGRCGCPAGHAGDRCCKHLGALALADGYDPDAPADPTPPARCGYCGGGKGFDGGDAWYECHRCRGTGIAG